MTEMIDIRKRILWPERKLSLKQQRQPRPVRYAIDPTAFVAAVIGAPLLVTAATFWALGIPVFALLFGGPVYVALSIPVLLWDIPRHEPTIGRLATLGFVSAMGFVALLCMVWPFVDEHEWGFFVGLYAVMGAIFGPLWK